MDLSNLSSNLPLTKPISQESVDGVNQQLNNEFKDAAKSVTNLYNNLSQSLQSSQDPSPSQPKDSDYKEDFTKAAKSIASLYRLSRDSSHLNHYFGYLSCLNDLLSVIENGEDLENWILTKKHELENQKDDSRIDTTQEQEDNKEDKERFNIRDVLNHEFSMDDELISPYKFRLGYPQLSRRSRQKERPKPKEKVKEKAKEKVKEKPERLKKDNKEEESEESEDEETCKRKSHLTNIMRKKVKFQ
ncbi:hypothetical protein CLIB1444_01S16930 [[Candida] jaroonii]|uniref:Uncharacterized protein n=1 Tax=[Candida] jaroonii TaxID=467808 RepID=A0ACA9Y1R4_9ASCO|nr:hypothetical protein CLIB1444_01S16930 [[Candida] jaroonii]